MLSCLCIYVCAVSVFSAAAAAESLSDSVEHAVIRAVDNTSSDDDTIYVAAIGSYTSEIFFAQFDASDGSLSYLNDGHGYNVGRNPSALVINTAQNMLYTVNEFGAEDSKVVCAPFDPQNDYAIDTSAITSQSSFGSDPCFVTTNIDPDTDHDTDPDTDIPFATQTEDQPQPDSHFLYLANYGGLKDSSFAIWQINDADGFISAEARISQSFAQPSHIHCILPNAHNASHFYVTDLARSRVSHYEMVNDNRNATLKSFLEFDDDSGPRTLTFHPVLDGVMYVSFEQANRVAVLSFDTDTYALLATEQYISTLAQPINASETSFVSHVMTDYTGKFLYVANRFTNNIASFSIDASTGLLDEHSRFINACGGEIPRQFNIDPSNGYVLVCNQGSDNNNIEETNISVLRIDHGDGSNPATGHLTFVNRFKVLHPSWIAFVGS